MKIYENDIINQQSLSKKIANFVKQQILEGQLQPGDQLIVRNISEKLGVSQTPVREAIQHLSGENIIVYIRNKGYFIYRYGKEDAFEIYSLRATMEGLAIRLATQRCDKKSIKKLESIYADMQEKLYDKEVPSLSNHSLKIHNFIYQMSNHKRLIKFNESISFQISVLNRILGSKSTKQFEVEEHKELIEVIKEGDPKLAEQTMRDHIYRSYEKFLNINHFDHIEPPGQSDFDSFHKLFPK